MSPHLSVIKIIALPYTFASGPSRSLKSLIGGASDGGRAGRNTGLGNSQTIGSPSSGVSSPAVQPSSGAAAAAGGGGGGGGLAAAGNGPSMGAGKMHSTAQQPVGLVGQQHDKHCTSVSFSPDGKLVVGFKSGGK